MRWLKIIGGLLGALILIGILAFVLLITFVSPNRFKPLITEEVKKHTGRELIIDGDLSWTIFPYLGLKVGHLEITNPPEFKEKIFAEIHSATVGVRVLPLLHAKIESSGVTLHGLKLNLIKNANGKTNWQMSGKPSETTPTESAPSAPSASPSAASLGLAIDGVDISNATISWMDEQSKQYFDINKFEMHLKDIKLTEPFPFEANFHFVGKNPDISGTVSLTSKIALNLEKQNYTLHQVNLATRINQGAKKFDINLKGDLAADMARDKLTLDNLQVQMANLKMAGKVNIADLTAAPKAKGHVQILPVDVKKLLQTIGEDVASIQSMKNLSGNFDFSAEKSLRSVNLQGNVKLDELSASKIRVNNIALRTNLQNGVLELSPISASLYQGSLDGKVKVNLNSSSPQISIQTKLSNVQTQSLLADLTADNKLKLTGLGNIDLEVTTAGTASDKIVKNLNGTAHLSVNNGTLQGVDIGFLLDSAYAFANKNAPAPGNNTNQTQFGTFTATAMIHNGVVTINDLNLDSTRSETKGHGKIDLVNQQINYRLQAAIKQNSTDKKNNLMNMYGLPIPISITGNLSNPSIHLDTQVLMKALAQQQMQKAGIDIQKKIQDKIKVKIPDEASALIGNFLGR